MWKRFRSNIGAMVGVVLLVAVIFIAIFAPLIFANTPWQMVQRPFLAPFAMESLPLGTEARNDLLRVHAELERDLSADRFRPAGQDKRRPCRLRRGLRGSDTGR